MADGFNWTCPTCGSHTTITGPNHCYRTLDVFASNTPNNKGIVVGAVLIECPNQQCLAQSFKVTVKRASRQSGFTSLRESSVPVGWHRIVHFSAYYGVPTVAIRPGFRN